MGDNEWRAVGYAIVAAVCAFAAYAGWTSHKGPPK